MVGFADRVEGEKRFGLPMSLARGKKAEEEWRL